MRLKGSIIFLFLIFSGYVLLADHNQAALKSIQKGKLDKAELYVQKSLQKDSINPGANYFYSLLFIKEGFRAYNIDSSYYHILRAMHFYDYVSPKNLKKLHKMGVNDSVLNSQKELLDSLAFELAKEGNTIHRYSVFLMNHPTAKQVSEAEEIRSEIAFRQALQINTYESFKYFIENYPHARQVKEATELFQILLFETFTKDKRLDSYEVFLKRHPETPYRNVAERNIFELLSIANMNEDYEKFIKSYPQSKFLKNAYAQLYHNYKEEGKKDVFFQKYKNVPQVDSLKRLGDISLRPLIPVMENNMFGFIDFSGQEIIPPSFEYIKTDYLCGNIVEEVLLAGTKKNPKLVSRNGHIIFDRPFDDIAHLGYGLIKVRSSKKQGLVSHSGVQVLPLEYKEITLLKGHFVKTEHQGKVELWSLQGKKILAQQYDDIFFEGDFLIVESDNKYAVLKVLDMIENIREDQAVPLNFEFDEVELIDQNYLLVIAGQQEALMDRNLKYVIPPAVQNIKDVRNIWLVKGENGYRIFDKENFLKDNTIYEDAVLNKKFLALKKGKKWAILETFGGAFPEFIHDSVRLLSENIILTVSGPDKYAVFENQVKVDFSNMLNFKLLKPVNANVAFGNDAEYFLCENQTGHKKLYDKYGKLLLEGSFNDINITGDGLLLLSHSNGKKSIADTNGKILVPAKYDGIGNYSKGYFALLNNGKFGIYNPQKDLKIEPQYEIGIQPYNHQLLVAVKGKKKGIIDFDNKILVPFEYNDIQFWSDNLALVRKDRWMIYDIYKKEVVSDGIDNWKYVTNTAEETLIIYHKDAVYGVLHNKKGEIVPPLYSDIINIGTADEPVFFTEKVIREADFYVVLYYNKKGEIFRKQAFSREEYDKVICD